MNCLAGKDFPRRKIEGFPPKQWVAVGLVKKSMRAPTRPRCTSVSYVFLTCQLQRVSASRDALALFHQIHCPRFPFTPFALSLWERVGVRGEGHGVGGEEGIPHRLQDPTRVCPYLVVPEAKHANALLLQVSRSPFIPASLIRFPMLSAIEFNGQPGLMTVEIQDVSANGVLSAKLGAPQLAISEKSPKKLLRVRVIMPHRTAQGQHFRGKRPLVDTFPHPNPLPRGEGTLPG